MNPERIQYLTDNFAALPGELAILRPEDCSDTSVYIQLLQLRGRRSEDALYCRLIREECGKTGSGCLFGRKRLRLQKKQL